MNRLFAYLKFWWHSKNEHGVHSPFVFDLVTKCFYDRSKHSAYQQLSNNDSKSKFLIRLATCFKLEICFLPETIDPKFKHAFNLNHNISAFKTIDDLINTKPEISKTPCLIYLDLNSIEESSIADLFKLCHKDSIILIPSIRETKTIFKHWNQLKSQSEISVSIDTFYWGLLFFRTEQSKEHFTIRL
ncbi:hypothetical protein N9887_00825 [Flavobacteriaceae bacterium]|nr:hypothetical protein [Flavobacteriaceae bacterium]